MKLSGTKRIAVLAVFSALTAVFYPIPFCFLLPVLLASIWFDYATAAILGAILGVLGYAFSFLGGSPLSLAFVAYPYIAIVPRLFVGVATCAVYRGLRRCTRNRDSMFLKFAMPAGVAGFVGSLVNTGGVLGLFALCAGDAVFGDTAMSVLLVTWAVSGAIEAGVQLLLTPAIDAVGRKVLIRTGLKSGR